MSRIGSLAGRAFIAGWCLIGFGPPAAATALGVSVDRPQGPQGPTLRPVAWRRVPSPDPRGGADFGALMQVADSDLSDVGLAGMMVRCRDRRLETVFIVLDPLPPRTPAQVRLAANGMTLKEDATLIPTGAGLLVPIDIVSLMQGSWRDGPALKVTIEAGAEPIKGVVSLEGLATPLQALEADCEAPSFGTE